jgi:hypothetical protein
VPQELLGQPAYVGMKLYHDDKSGFGVWLPSDWTQYKMRGHHRGFLFSPYKDDINTSILIEKRRLKVTVTADDMDVLREGFLQGIKDLPGVEIESQDEHLTESVNLFEARFTFLEGESRRKRWVRNVYWGNGQLILIAQGRTVEDFEYWLPMFFNTMTTTQLI